MLAAQHHFASMTAATLGQYDASALYAAAAAASTAATSAAASASGVPSAAAAGQLLPGSSAPPLLGPASIPAALYSTHSFASSGALSPTDVTDDKIPGFIRKTFNLLSCTATHHIASWDASGTAFAIHKMDAFAADMLPKYFRHRNFSSFVRQLNFYGFRLHPHTHAG